MKLETSKMGPFVYSRYTGNTGDFFNIKTEKVLTCKTVDFIGVVASGEIKLARAPDGVLPVTLTEGMTTDSHFFLTKIGTYILNASMDETEFYTVSRRTNWLKHRIFSREWVTGQRTAIIRHRGVLALLKGSITLESGKTASSPSFIRALSKSFSFVALAPIVGVITWVD